MSDAAYPEEAIVALLELNEGVTDLTTADCIYPMAAPSDITRPYLIYGRSNVAPASMDLEHRQYNAQLTISAWADSYGGVRALADAVKTALIGRTYQDGAIEINTIVLVSEGDEFEPSIPGRDKPLFGVNMEFDYSYQES